MSERREPPRGEPIIRPDTVTPEATSANRQHSTLVRSLSVLFAAVFAWSAWYPRYPDDWVIENVVVAVAIAALVCIYRRVPFSRASWCLAFLFLAIHEIGAHWTYSEVPYRQLFGLAAGDTRNHFDRLVHFLYGLLQVWPMRNLLLSLRVVTERSASFFAIDLIISTSTIYELAEWTVGEYVAGELATAYLGMQGDLWDAQKDIALALAGAVTTVTMVAIASRLRQKAN